MVGIGLVAETGLDLAVLTVERVREDEVVVEAVEEEEGLMVVTVEEEGGRVAVALAVTGAKLLLWF